MANGTPSADDLLGQMNDVAPARQPVGQQPPMQAQPSAPSSDDLLTQMNTVAPPRQGTTTGTTTGTTGEGIARNVAAGAIEGGGSGFDILTDPVGNLVMRPAGIALAAGYDLGARLFGYNPLTPEQRADITGANATPQERGLGSTAVSTIGKAIDADPAAVVPQGPTEAAARAAASGLVMGGAFGGRVLPAVAGAVGGAGGNVLASQVPDWAAPATNLAVNALAQGVASRLGGSGTSSIAPSDAATAILANQKYGVPIDATDVTPNSPFRTPSGVQAKMDAWQGALVKELGEDPNTPDILSRNRITNKVMTDTADRAGQVMDDVAQRTTIGPMQTYDMLQKLQAVENSLPTTPGLDIPAITRNIAAIKQQIDPQTGQMTGKAAQSFTKTGGLLDRLENNGNTDVADIGRQLSNIVDNAFIKSAAPQDAIDLTQAKYQWRLMKTLQPLVAKAQGGNIDPGAFTTQAINASRRFDPSTGGIAYTGGGNIGELARIGSLIKNGPTPTATPFLRQVLTPPSGMLGYFVNPLLAGLAHGAEVGGRLLAGPIARSGWNANRAFQNALMGPAPGTWSGGIVPGLATGANPLVVPTR